MINPLSILVLSDIHWGGDSIFTELTKSEDKTIPYVVEDEIIACCINKNIKMIFVPGDLTSLGQPIEFDNCVKSLKYIANKLSIPIQNILFAYGNHDINWDITKIGTTKGDVLYDQVAANIPHMFAENIDCVEKGPVIGSGVFHRENVTIYILNSSHYSTHSQEYEHGKLGEEQLAWFKEAVKKYKDLNKWQVLLVHHHPFKYSFPVSTPDISCLEEGSDLEDILGGIGIDLVCHGHRHHPKIFTKLQQGWVKPITFFCSGSLSIKEQARARGQIPNFFHIIDLESHHTDGAAIGSIKTYEFSMPKGWIPLERNQTCQDLDSCICFGAVLTSSQIETFAQNLIKGILEAQDKNHYFPTHKDLPLQLRCMTYGNLNEILKKIAREKFNKGLIGGYPEKVAIER